MNKFNTKIIYPLVGSIGLTAYLFDNNKYVLNYKNRRLIEDLQFRSTILIMEHFQINKNFGNVLTTTIERESILEDLNKSKTKLNFEMKIKKGKSLELDDYFANVQVNSSLHDTKWNIDSLDIQFLSTKPKILKRLYESLDTEAKSSSDKELVYKNILKSHNLKQGVSKECIDKLKQDLPIVLNSISDLLNDEKKLNILGKPIMLQLESIYLNDRLTAKVRVKGKKQIANLYISGDRNKTDLECVGVMFELDEDLYMNANDLACGYVDKIASKNSQLKEILAGLNLNRVIEEKLYKDSRALDSIGRPIKLDNYSFKQDTSFGAQLVLVFKGRLNSANLLVNLIRDQDTEKWKIDKCQLKMIWS